MDEKERYFWDLTGYLVVKNVLDTEELKTANAAIDYCVDRINQGEDNKGVGDSTFLRGTGSRWMHGTNLLNIDPPYCQPFRQMLAHPAVVSRLNLMCGKGFRLDHGPQFNNAVKGTTGLTLHGSGDPHKPYVAYHHQNGGFHCAGVTVTWNLSAAPAGGGGFACVPGSHKSKFTMPKGVRNCDDDMGAVVQPEIRAGDILFFMDGAQTHGTHPWRNDHQRRSVLFKYASRTANRGGSRPYYEPETYWDEEIVSGMTPEERAVMFGPTSAPKTQEVYLAVEPDGTVRLDN